MNDSKNAGSSNHERRMPVLFERREQCCGCSACYAICPQNAIVMETDEEGFLYPRIMNERCIQCYRCLSVCAFKADQKGRGDQR